MKTFPCKPEHCRALNRNVNGTFHLYPWWNGHNKTKDVFIGRKMPNGRVFVSYGREIEMYEPGEYEIVEVDE